MAGSEVMSECASDQDFIEFNEEEENEIFHDANEQIIKTVEMKADAKQNRFHILGVDEERISLPHLRPPN